MTPTKEAPPYTAKKKRGGINVPGQWGDVRVRLVEEWRDGKALMPKGWLGAR